MLYCVGAHTIQSYQIDLPTSKSIANRIFLLHALSGTTPTNGEATCDDILAMQQAINNPAYIIDIGDAGTVMRFLTAYYASIQGAEHILTGSLRMQQRPIGALVEALRSLGANIDYTGKEGYPPLSIHGTQLQGGAITIAGNTSSQYISALLLVAPRMCNGLQLTITKPIVSRPYIAMTIELMHLFGAKVTCNGNLIDVAPGQYTPTTIEIESDWSAASYWYEIVAISHTAMTLTSLQMDSLQGDARVAQYFAQLGVKTDYNGKMLSLSSIPIETEKFIAHLADTPDIAPTLAMTCALQNIPFLLTGLDNLPLKECDRIAVLISEAQKLGFSFTSSQSGSIAWDGKRTSLAGKDVCIDPHGDHRMAMAFAPAALVMGHILIENPQVVNKSYPHFWDNLCQAGFTIETKGKEASL